MNIYVQTQTKRNTHYLIHVHVHEISLVKSCHGHKLQLVRTSSKCVLQYKMCMCCNLCGKGTYMHCVLGVRQAVLTWRLRSCCRCPLAASWWSCPLCRWCGRRSGRRPASSEALLCNKQQLTLQQKKNQPNTLNFSWHMLVCTLRKSLASKATANFKNSHIQLCMSAFDSEHGGMNEHMMVYILSVGRACFRLHDVHNLTACIAAVFWLPVNWDHLITKKNKHS